MLRLYHDEDALQEAVVSAFRRAGFDCLTTAEAGNRGNQDEQQLAFGASLGRALFTSNTGDFNALHTAWINGGRQHQGIILLTEQRTPVGVQLRAMLALSQAVSDNGLVNRVEYLLNWA